MEKQPQSIVYIVQDNPLHAFWPAEKFGKLQQCLPAKADMRMSHMIPRLRKALLDFTDNDYLLLSGGPITCGVAFAILHERFDKLNVLRWSSAAQDYFVTPCDLMQTEMDNGDSDGS